MQHRADIHFPPKHEPLRDDVHALGALVGEILREQGGEALFEQVEATGSPRSAAATASRARARSCSARCGPPAGAGARPGARLLHLVPGRQRRREGAPHPPAPRLLRQGQPAPQPGGVEDAIAALKAQGLTPARCSTCIGSLSIEPVFAPHSTEASRRTLLRKQQRIAQRLLERLDPSLTPHEARSIWDNVRMDLTAAWQTEELPRERLTVADEREQILFYLVEILYRVVPAFYEEISQALEKVYDAKPGTYRVPSILHFGSWAGGDMDGNPDVHAKTIRDTLARQHQVIVNSYFHECQELAQRLSQSASRVAASPELGKRMEQYMTLLPGRARHHPGAPRPHALPGVPRADRRAAAQRLRGPRQQATRARASSATTSP